MQNHTPETVKKALLGFVQIARAVADAIRELQEVPSGHLYAGLMSQIDITLYNKVLDTLKGAKLIEAKGDLLRWIGPAK